MPPVHAHEGDGAVAHHPGHVAERVREEGGELGFAHLTRCKGELAVLDRAEAADIAINRDVVGRVGKHEGPEPLDGGGDLLDLPFGVRPGTWTKSRRGLSPKNPQSPRVPHVGSCV